MSPISLVVATHGRVTELRELLDSLLPFAGDGIEVIVADQNPDDRVAEVLRAHPLPVRHLRLDRPNACAARNAGAAVASHEWLGFPDDDCRFLPGTLAALRAAIASSGAPVISGMTVNEAGRPNILNWRRRAGRYRQWGMWRCATESTLFMRRDLFLGLGGFDPAFGPGAPFPAAEGAELLSRAFASAADLHGWFASDLRLYHPTKIPPWTESAVARVYDYAFGEGGLLAKHSTPACWWRTFRFVTKHSLAGILPMGFLGQCSRRKLRGLVHGYRAYGKGGR